MCGLYGIINREKTTFRRDVFTILGIANDRRGGDSCGVFIDGEVEYGIGKNALFEDFFWNSKLINNTEKCQIVLGHDRKASVGAVTVEKAHPILIKNNKGEVDFVLIHNGTLHNYESLAKKYIPDIDCSKYSDSQVLALILYHKGFDVLSEYNGGAAFVAVDYRSGKPVTYLFKGASKNNSLSKEETEERPLYFTFNTEYLVFSSIPSCLCALYDDVYEATNNYVYQYIDGKIYLYKTVDRSKCQQTKEYAVCNNNGYWNNSINFTYMQYDEHKNIYTDDSKKSLPLQGKQKITSYSRILEPNSKIVVTEYLKVYTIFFFNGIPFSDKFSYNIVNKAFKKSGMDINDFIRKNEVFVRFHSVSKQFFEGSECKEAVSEFGHKPFTGNLPILGKTVVREYINGKVSGTKYCNNYNQNFESLKL